MKLDESHFPIFIYAIALFKVGLVKLLRTDMILIRDESKLDFEIRKILWDLKILEI